MARCHGHGCAEALRDGVDGAVHRAERLLCLAQRDALLRPCHGRCGVLARESRCDAHSAVNLVVEVLLRHGEGLEVLRLLLVEGRQVRLLRVHPDLVELLLDVLAERPGDVVDGTVLVGQLSVRLVDDAYLRAAHRVDRIDRSAQAALRLGA
ncbi:MAG: hypothetical protein ACLTYW_00080 [Collinsella sp.]